MTIWCFKVVKNIATHVVLLLETWSWGHVLNRRQVKRTTETLRRNKNNHRSSQVCHISFYIFYSLFVQYSLVLFSKNTCLSLCLWGLLPSVCLQSSHMGGDVFVIHTLKSKAVVSYFCSSVTQARIITVQLLARVAAAGRMASVGQSFWRPGESAFNCGVRRLFSVRCKSLKVRLHNVLLPFNSYFFVLCYQQYRALLYMYTSLFLWYFVLNLSPWFLWIVIFFGYV